MTEKEFKDEVWAAITVPEDANIAGECSRITDLAKEAGATFEPEVEVVWEGTADYGGSSWRHRLLADGRWQHGSPSYAGGKWFDKEPSDLHRAFAGYQLTMHEHVVAAGGAEAQPEVGTPGPWHATYDVKLDDGSIWTKVIVEAAAPLAAEVAGDWADAAAREWIDRKRFSSDTADRTIGLNLATRNLAAIFRRHAEEEIWGDRAALEESTEIIAELTATIAALVGEPAPEKCTPDCGLPHLTPKASAAAKKALDRWLVLTAKLDRIAAIAAGKEG